MIGLADPSCDNGDWYLSFDKQGSALKANNYAFDHINHLEGAKCCKAFGEFSCENESNCKQVSWKSTIGRYRKMSVYK